MKSQILRANWEISVNMSEVGCADMETVVERIYDALDKEFPRCVTTNRKVVSIGSEDRVYFNVITKTPNKVVEVINKIQAYASQT